VGDRVVHVVPTRLGLLLPQRLVGVAVDHAEHGIGEDAGQGGGTVGAETAERPRGDSGVEHPRPLLPRRSVSSRRSSLSRPSTKPWATTPSGPAFEKGGGVGSGALCGCGPPSLAEARPGGKSLSAGLSAGRCPARSPGRRS